MSAKGKLLQDITLTITWQKNDLDRVKRFKEFIKQALPTDFTLNVSHYRTNLIISVFSKEELHKAREFCRSFIPDYVDKLNGLHSDYSSGVYAQYTCKFDYGVIDIRWNFTIETTPEEFTKDGCKWETLPSDSSYSTFVCPI